MQASDLRAESFIVNNSHTHTHTLIRLQSQPIPSVRAVKDDEEKGTRRGNAPEWGAYDGGHAHARAESWFDLPARHLFFSPSVAVAGSRCRQQTPGASPQHTHANENGVSVPTTEQYRSRLVSRENGRNYDVLGGGL